MTMKSIALLVCLAACLVPCQAFVVKPTSPRTSTVMASSRLEGHHAMQGFGRFAAAAALSLVILVNPAPSLADGMLL